MGGKVRRLILVLGDQLDLDSPAWQDIAPQQDVVWMAEVAQESTEVWSHKARIAPCGRGQSWIYPSRFATALKPNDSTRAKYWTP